MTARLTVLAVALCTCACSDGEADRSIRPDGGDGDDGADGGGDGDDGADGGGDGVDGADGGGGGDVDGGATTAGCVPLPDGPPPVFACDWTSETLDDPPFWVHEAKVLVDSAGTVHILYRTGAENRMRHGVRPVGGVFTFEFVPVDRITLFDVALDADDGIHVAATTEPPPDEIVTWIRYAHLPAGGSWAQTTLPPERAVGPEIVIDPAGTVHLAYEQWLPGGGRQAGWGTRPAGGDWTFEAAIGGEDYAVPADLAIGAQGDLHLSLVQGAARLEHGVRAGAGGDWTRTLVDDETGVISSSLQVDPAGLVHIAYWDYEPGGLRYACGQGDAWTTSAFIDPVYVGAHPVQRIGPAGGRHILVGGDSVRYLRQLPGAGWEATTVADLEAWSPDLWIDAAGGAHIVYAGLFGGPPTYASCPAP